MNVLLIDDDSTFRFIAKMITEKSGILQIIAEANDGESGLDFLRDCVNKKGILPDVILLDLNMPRMNGWEFLRQYPEIFRENRRIPVVVVSSSINREDREKSETFPCVKGMISKPLTEADLHEIRALVHPA